MNTYSIPISTTIDINIDFKTIYNIIVNEYSGQEITDDEIWYVFGDNILYYLNMSGIDISKFDDDDSVFDEIWYDFDKWLKNNK